MIMEPEDDDPRVIPPRFLSFHERHGLTRLHSLPGALAYIGAFSCFCGTLMAIWASETTESIVGYCGITLGGGLLILALFAHRRQRRIESGRWALYLDWRHTRGQPPASSGISNDMDDNHDRETN